MSQIPEDTEQDRQRLRQTLQEFNDQRNRDASAHCAIWVVLATVVIAGLIILYARNH